MRDKYDNLYEYYVKKASASWYSLEETLYQVPKYTKDIKLMWEFEKVRPTMLVFKELITSGVCGHYLTNDQVKVLNRFTNNNGGGV